MADNLLATPDGGSLYTSSFVDDLGLGFAREGVLVKKTGNPSWTTRLSYSNASDAYIITRAHVAINTPDGGYLLAGQYLNSKSATRASWVAKLDGQGNISWQTIILIPSPNPGDVSRVDDSWDAIVSADGTGYALVGQGSTSPNTSATVLVEIHFNGKVKTGRVKAIDGPLVTASPPTGCVARWRRRPGRTRRSASCSTRSSRASSIPPAPPRAVLTRGGFDAAGAARDEN